VDVVMRCRLKEETNSSAQINKESIKKMYLLSIELSIWLAQLLPIPRSFYVSEKKERKEKKKKIN